MSLKLPNISGRKAITVFETIGYQVVRQKGSHIRLRDDKILIIYPVNLVNPVRNY